MNTQVLRAPISKLFSLQPDKLKNDLVAGVTVSLVAIPQSLAYAQLAGVPAYYGLYAALVRPSWAHCSVPLVSFPPVRWR